MKARADKILAQKILDGDRSAFDAFFNAYYPRLYRFSLTRLGGDVDLADETAQLVICQALSKMHTYRGEAPLFSWLCTFCRFELSKQRKARQRAQGDTPLSEDDPAVKSALDSLLAETACDPDVALYQTEIKRLIKVALDHIPSVYADALEAKYVRDLTVAEIAKNLDKSVKATESLLTRARDAFREAFGVLLDEENARRKHKGSVSELLDLQI